MEGCDVSHSRVGSLVTDSDSDDETARCGEGESVRKGVYQDVFRWLWLGRKEERTQE